MIHAILHVLRGGRIKLVDDSGPIQKVQVFEGDLSDKGGPRTINGVPNVNHFGFASVPPLDSEALLASTGGNRSHTYVIGTNHQPSRLKNLKPGDAGVYDVRGAKIILTEDGILIDAAGLPIAIQNFSTCTVKGDLHVEGDVISRSAGDAVSLNGLHDAYNQHGHLVTGGAGSTTQTTNKPA